MLDGDNGNSPWSTMRSFTICSSPVTDTLTNPIPPAEAVDVSIPVNLSWDTIAGVNISFDVMVYDYCATGEEGYVCNDNDLIAYGVDVYTQWTIDQVLEPGTDYWWKVRVNHICGSNDFAPQKFTTGNCPEVPNGPDRGTCTAGNEGAACSEADVAACQSGCGKALRSCQVRCSPGAQKCREDCQEDYDLCAAGCDDGCGEGGFCSQAQEDADGDGAGDVCDLEPGCSYGGCVLCEEGCLLL